MNPIRISKEKKNMEVVTKSTDGFH